MAKPNFTHSLLKSEMRYDSATGKFTRLVSAGRAKPGPATVRLDKDGYEFLSYRGSRFYVHRLAWFYVHAKWPKEYIDHINGISADNRLSNLRESTNSENQQNLVARRPKTAGKLIGTAWHEHKKAWISRIGIDRKRVCLGYFATAQEAHEAYLEAKKTIHLFQPTPRDEHP